MLRAAQSAQTGIIGRLILAEQIAFTGEVPYGYRVRTSVVGGWRTIVPDADVIAELSRRGTVWWADGNDDACANNPEKIGESGDGKPGDAARCLFISLARTSTLPMSQAREHCSIWNWMEWSAMRRRTSKSSDHVLRAVSWKLTN
ncbi:MAG TPA: hypothetical protein VGV14_06830 [Rhodanobacter sp.]|nr:hypothetical protein [Rhodanobacter sp.]